MCHRVFVFLLLTAIVWATGCEKDVEKSTESPVADFIVSVNGKKLTSSELDRRVGMMIHLKTLSEPTTSAAQIEKFKKLLVQTYPDLFVSKILLAEYAESNAIRTTPETLESARKSTVRRFRQTQAKTWPDLLAKMGDYSSVLEDQVEFEARRNQVFRFISDANPTNLTPDFVTNQIEFAKSYNARMDLTNAVTHARATNVWQKLVAGGNFGELAAKHSDLPVERAERGEWGALDWAQIERDPPLFEAAQKLKPGEFSAPIEADNGLMILRVDKKDVKECKMSRIFFSLPLYREVPTAEKVVSVVKKTHAARVFKQKMAELRKKAEIVWGDQAPSKSAHKSKDPNVKDSNKEKGENSK